MEDIEERVRYENRLSQLNYLVRNNSSDALIKKVSEMITQAYIAGWNRYTPSNGKVIMNDNDIDALTRQERGMNLENQPLVMAINYTKDKGFRR